MYLVQEVLHVANGKNPEAVKRLNWIHSLMQPQPGFVGAQVCAYMGNSSRHLILRMWEDKAAFEAFRATPEGSGYSKNRPPGLYEGQPCGREWELLQETAGPDTGSFLIRGEFTVNDGRWDDYLAVREAQGALQLESGGLQYARNFRQLDTENGALALVRKTGKEDHMRYVESLTKSDLRNTAPPGHSAPRSGEYMEYYEIIDEVTP